MRSYSVVRQMGGQIKLAEVNQRVLEVLEISQLNSFFEIHSGESAALQAFGRRA